MPSPTNPALRARERSANDADLDFREMLGMKTGRDYADAETRRFKKTRLAAQVEALKKR